MKTVHVTQRGLLGRLLSLGERPPQVKEGNAVQHGMPKRGSTKTQKPISIDLIIRQLESAPVKTRKLGAPLHVSEIRIQPERSFGTEKIARILKVTETEAQLAITLTNGKTLQDFARMHGCTLRAARTHARTLLEKTGCLRQAEVTQLVLDLLA